MIISSAEFIKSSTRLSQCPEPSLPEYAFLGRSNVGKSSLINMLVGRSKLAKTSATPGKTQTINHFLINKNWYIADLPGYGYAKVSKTKRDDWKKMIENYILNRKNLMTLFLLIDSRHDPILSDIEFMNFLGMKYVPFARIFTKADKTRKQALEGTIENHNKRLLENWEELPPLIITSAEDKRGRDELLGYIEKSLDYFDKP
jgi:GTP-binding protein